MSRTMRLTSPPYGKVESSARSERAKRRDARTAVFHKECNDKQAQAVKAKSAWLKKRKEKRDEADRAAMTDEDKAKEKAIVDKVCKLEDQLAAFTKNGFKDADIMALKISLGGKDWRSELGDKLYKAGNVGCYVVHFAGYLGAFELAEACIQHDIHSQHHAALEIAYQVGHKEFVDKARERGWWTWRLEENRLGTFGAASDLLELSRLRMSNDRPKFVPYGDIYRLRSLTQLLG